MRDLLNLFDKVLNEVTISKAKYGPGTQFSLSGSQPGQKLSALMQQDGFDTTAPLTLYDLDSMSNEEIIKLPTISMGAGADGYLFSNDFDHRQCKYHWTHVQCLHWLRRC
jgi:hypothetical protein